MGGEGPWERRRVTRKGLGWSPGGTPRSRARRAERGGRGRRAPAAGAVSVSSAHSPPLLPRDPPALPPPLTARETEARGCGGGRATPVLPTRWARGHRLPADALRGLGWSRRWGGSAQGPRLCRRCRIAWRRSCRAHGAPGSGHAGACSRKPAQRAAAGNAVG